MNMHHLLVPLDGSSWSDAIVPTLCQLFDPAQYQVTLLRVAEEPVGARLVPDPLFVDPFGMAGTYPVTVDRQPSGQPIYEIQMVESERAAFEDALQRAGQPLHAAGFTVAVAVRFGDPAAEIVAFAQTQPVDLVAMTTHGRTGVRRVLMGSVAEHVMRNTAVPVLLLRPLVTPSEGPGSEMAEVGALSRLQPSLGGTALDERDAPIKDADANVVLPPDEESDHNLAGQEVSPAAMAAQASRNPFMEIEEQTLPEDFRPFL
ncbi:MAG: universal stress protein [Herpetosiphonaceae bacterium]|nr:universal stress protein [Herpetosiphonaceae bacterium]